MTIIPLEQFKAMLTNGEPGGVHWKKKHGRDHATAAIFAAEPGTESGEPEESEDDPIDEIPDHPTREQALPFVERAQRIEAGEEEPPPSEEEKQAGEPEETPIDKLKKKMKHPAIEALKKKMGGAENFSAFVESDHPRGQPDNAGKFASKPGGGSIQASGSAASGQGHGISFA